ncbi:MAG: endopeptidase La [Lachnospiraceae bacterium]|nr:endopeptidase La [Lachnospiraceae bacterium]
MPERLRKKTHGIRNLCRQRPCRGKELCMKIPVVPLRGIVAIPGTAFHFDVERPRSVAAVEAALAGDKRLFVAAQKDPAVDEPGADDISAVGTVVHIRQKIPMGSTTRVICAARSRAESTGYDMEGEYITAEVVLAPLSHDGAMADPAAREAMRRILEEDLENYVRENRTIKPETARQVMDRGGSLPEILRDLCGVLQLPWSARQHLLEAQSEDELFRRVTDLLRLETEIHHIKNEIQSEVKKSIDKNQKEYVLREQMKIIHEELGDTDVEEEADEFAQKIADMAAPDSVKEKLNKEVKLLRSLGPGNQEANVHRMYLETVLELPWGVYTEENPDVAHAREILDRDHDGLDDVKERVLEHLAVRRLTDGKNAAILCLAGPPGTGKTSVARSIAEALGRKYVRVCLGGVRDEAEIRGHRKTYLGSMPGRIAEALRQAGSMNPLMLLDEIDKLGNDYKGDPSSALLEVLDGEQNMHFRDHYLEVPLDLSAVMFVATANVLDTVPRPLLDRMEVIEIAGYSSPEKLRIAKNHLVPKQRKVCGLTEEQFGLTDEAILALISGYTREAGVRNLERRIGELCRKKARAMMEGQEMPAVIGAGDLEGLLGPAKHRVHPADKDDEVGLVHGLAWTQVGGETLEIEVSLMEGSGKLQLTGKLGEVMKESAQIALSYVRSVAADYGISAEFFDKHDIHVHVPEGAVPKDGPSAGISIATAILSAVSGKKVRADLAMTGEVTLRGRVLPIGGLKEKLLAAREAGIGEVLLPSENEPDARELADEVTSGLTLTYVGNMSEVAQAALR